MSKQPKSQNLLKQIWNGFHQHIGEPCGKPVIIDLESLFNYCYNHLVHDQKYGPQSLTVIYKCEEILSKFLKFGHLVHILGFCNFLKSDSPMKSLFKEIFKNNLIKLSKKGVFTITDYSIFTIEDLRLLNPSSIFILNGESDYEKHLIFLAVEFDIPIYLLENIEVIKNGIYSYSLKDVKIEPIDPIKTEIEKNDFDWENYQEFLKKLGDYSSNSKALMFACFKMLKQWSKEDHLIQILFLYSLFKDLIPICQRSFQYNVKSEELKTVISFFNELSVHLLGITNYDKSISNDLLSGNFFLFLCKFFSQNPITLNEKDTNLWNLISGESKFTLSKSDFKFQSLNQPKNENDIIIHEIDNYIVKEVIGDFEERFREKFKLDSSEIIGKKFIDSKHWHSDLELQKEKNDRSGFAFKYGKKIEMYVEKVTLYSSSKGDQFKVNCICGPEKIYPNPSHIVQKNGWIPDFKPKKSEFIVVEFEKECMIDTILLYETLNPGSLSHIYSIVKGKENLIYETVPKQDIKRAKITTLNVDSKDITNKLKFEFHPTKEFQIDAIKVRGTFYKKFKGDENSQVQKLMNFYQKFSASLGVSKSVILSTNQVEPKEKKVVYQSNREKKLELEKERQMIENLRLESLKRMNDVINTLSKIEGEPKVEDWKIYILRLFQMFEMKSELENYSFKDEECSTICKSIIYLGFFNDLKEILKKYNCQDVLDYYEKNEDQFKALQFKKYPFYRMQMKYLGNEMKKQTESFDDPRVAFKPDSWQKDLLDIVDNQKSGLVIAPTSAGKTFISYYAMKHAIENNKNKKSKTKQIVIMVVPTKALVNQVSSDIYSQYQDVFGIFTREQRKNVDNCSILVTVPQCLEIIFFSSNKESWMENIKYVIFDEIHLIGSDDGATWERLIQFCPSPFLALSATIGGTSDFVKWLKRVDKDIEVIQHFNRYSDIDNMVYSKNDLIYIHPLSFMNNSKSSVEDIILTPKELEDTYNSLKKVSSNVEDLSPESFFKNEYKILTRNDCSLYGKFLLKAIQKIRENDHNTYQKLINEFSQPLKRIELPEKNEFFDLINLLKKRDLLPCIAFSFSKLECTNLAQILMRILVDSEYKEMKENKCLNIIREIDNYRKNKRDSVMRQVQEQKQPVNPQLIEKMIEKIPDDLEKKFQLYCAIKKKYRYSINEFKYDPEDFWCSRLFKKVGWDDSHPLIKCLERGIGVHTSDMPIHYRNLVEVLFRMKKITIVFATGTLAYGINMPCRTTVFISESRFLTPLMYHQMRGRSGRRGFDKSGNSIFFRISTNQIGNLMMSPLPIIQGNHTLSVQLILKLFNLSSQSKPDLSRIQKLLFESIDQKPKEFIQSYFRYSIEFLIKMGLMDEKCNPIGLSEMVLHLGYEPGIFALLNIIQSEDFSKLCDGFFQNKDGVAKTILLIVCHLCNHVPTSKLAKKLEPLDDIWQKKIDNFNKDSLNHFTQFIKPFQKVLIEETPLSKEDDSNQKDCPREYYKTIQNFKMDKNIRIRSPFISICGKNDTYESVIELIDTCNDNLPLSFELIPTYQPRTEPSSYALTFYQKGSFSHIDMNDFRMKGSQAYNTIKAFCLTLQILYQTLKSYFETKEQKVEVKKEEVEDELDWNSYLEKEEIKENVKKTKTYFNFTNLNVLHSIKYLADDYNLKFKKAEEEDFHNYLEKVETNEDELDVN